MVAGAGRGPTASRATSFVADLAGILLFVAIGRSAHRHGVNADGMVQTTWPFAVGLLAGWAYVVVRNLQATAARTGVVLALASVAVGMVLRVLAGQGTAVAFVFVAIGFLGLAMVGWRLILHATSARNS